MHDISRHSYHLCYKVALMEPTFMFLLAVFQVDNDGIITTSAALDREQESQYIITITAVDMGVPVRSRTADVIITINDVNDNSPSFTGVIMDSDVYEVLWYSYTSLLVKSIKSTTITIHLYLKSRLFKH